MIEIGLIATSTLLLVICFLPLFPSNHWLCRIWEFPRVQIATLVFFNMLLSIFFTQNALMYILVVANLAMLIYQCIWITPYTVLYPKEVKSWNRNGDNSSTQIKVITSNVLMTNKSAHKLIDLVNQHQPDVLVTLESNQWWQDALEPIHQDFPYRVNRPLENLYGMHVYSRYEIDELDVRDLIEKDVPSIHCYIKFAENTKIKFHFVHPAPPSPTENETAKPRDKELILIAREVTPNQEPTIVTGDLNDVAWSPTTREFRKISSLKDPRIGRGFYNTFHADYQLTRWPLDHLFHSDHFILKDIKRLPSIDSDHFPFLTELVLRRQTKKQAYSSEDS